MCHQRVVNTSQRHFVVSQRYDAVLLFFHKGSQTGDGLAVGIVGSGLQGVQFSSLLVQKLLQASNLGFQLCAFGIQFFQLGRADLRATADHLRTLALGGSVAHLVNQTLNLGGLCLNRAVFLGKLAAVVVACALHLLILFHDVVQPGLHFVNRWSVLVVLVTGNKAAHSQNCNRSYLENRYLSHCLHCIYVFKFIYLKNILYFCNRIAKINLFF